MSDPKTGKNQNTENKDSKNKDSKNKDEAAQAAREQQLRELIEQVEKERSGSLRPEKESPHEFVERRRREKSKP